MPNEMDEQDGPRVDPVAPTDSKGGLPNYITVPAGFLAGIVAFAANVSLVAWLVLSRIAWPIPLAGGFVVLASSPVAVVVCMVLAIRRHRATSAGAFYTALLVGYLAAIAITLLILVSQCKPLGPG